MQVSVKANVKQLTKGLNKIQRKQIPFATSKALNTLAFDVRKTLQTVLPEYIDQPTPYTTRAIQVEKSTKKKLITTVGFRGFGFGKGKGSVPPAEYMALQIGGGTRNKKGRGIPVPTKHQKTNRYGNVVKGRINKLLADKQKFFSGIPKGMGKDAAGIWERLGKKGKLRMLIAWEDRAIYQKRFPFRMIVDKTIRTNFKKRFESALRDALQTAR